jgi:hypothetical protein
MDFVFIYKLNCIGTSDFYFNNYFCLCLWKTCQANGKNSHGNKALYSKTYTFYQYIFHETSYKTKLNYLYSETSQMSGRR